LSTFIFQVLVAPFWQVKVPHFVFGPVGDELRHKICSHSIMQGKITLKERKESTSKIKGRISTKESDSAIYIQIWETPRAAFLVAFDLYLNSPSYRNQHEKRFSSSYFLSLLHHVPIYFCQWSFFVVYPKLENTRELIKSNKVLE
jgi:hypothetical protein